MRIEHIAIWVKDLEIIRDFYIKYFNCKSSDKYINSKKFFSSYFLNFNNNDGSRIEIMNIGGLEKQDSCVYYGYAHIAISVGSKDRVDYITNILRADGFTVFSDPRITGDGYYESVVLAPEGNKIEITI